jgi:hypothetical protein
MNPVRTLRHFAGILLAGTATLFATAVGQPPAGLDEADWARLRSTLDGARHRIAATTGGHQAHNPGQRWRTRFEGQGFLVQPDGADWQWGLELTAYGFPGREHTVPTGSANTLTDVAETRLEYAWDAGMSEWFVNDARGLEHGFTVHERPDDRQVLDCGSPLPLSQAEEFTTPETSAEPKRQRTGAVQDAATMTTTLNFRLAVRGGLRPVLEPDRHGVRFVDADGTTRTTYAGLKVWDADGQILPAHFEQLDAGRPGEITLAVDERGARYPLTIDPIAQQAYLKASNTGTGDQFGTKVATSGDTLVVGASTESSQAVGVNGDQANDQAVGSGAAYVFVRQSGVWTQQAYLKASNTEAGDAFGSSVAISGDTVVIGASGEDSSATRVNGDQINNGSSDSGAAYVFVRNGGEWTQQAYLKASNTGLSDAFGGSVAVSGDTVVVGAAFEDSRVVNASRDGADNSMSDSGAAYVFVRKGTTWTQQVFLKASNAGLIALFGSSVSISADTVVIGAFGESSNATGVNGNQLNNQSSASGAAYVFVRNGTVWTQQAYLKASNTGRNDYFGVSVSVSGDTVAVGADGESSNAQGVNGDQLDNSQNRAGAVYVFARTGAMWSQQAYLKSDNTRRGSRFGLSVGLSDETLVVGAPFEAGYVFNRRGIVWMMKQGSLTARNSGEGDLFGNAVAVSGSTIVIGANQEAGKAVGVNGSDAGEGAFGAGAAYVFVPKTLGIRVEQPAGVRLTDGGANVRYPAVSVGGIADLTFTIRNSGTTNLSEFALALAGPGANQFSVTADPAEVIAPGGNSTFTVRFSPTSEGTKTATLHIASNDPVQNPFDVTLVGTPNVPTVAASGNDLTVSFVGTPGSRYRVQYLPGLTGSWTDFTPPALFTVPASGIISHTDLNPPDTLRLYRAVLVP